MGSPNNFGDIWRQNSAGINIAVGSSGGVAVSTAVFGAETYAVQLCYVNSTSGSTTGVHVLQGTAPVATSTAMILPPNVIYILKVTPGEKISVLGNDALTTQVLNVVELTK